MGKKTKKVRKAINTLEAYGAMTDELQARMYANWQDVELYMAPRGFVWDGKQWIESANDL